MNPQTQADGGASVVKRKTKTKRAPKRKRNAQEQLAARLDVIRSLAGAADDTVLTFGQWCALNSFSEATGGRILADPDPDARPAVIQLSAQRKGITIRANRAWQQSRSRSGAA
jgi:hypothetical protein